MKKIIIFVLLMISASISYGVDFPFQYQPKVSFNTLVKSSENGVFLHYPDGEKQLLINSEVLKEGHIVSDYNFDGYNDLAIKVGKDQRGLHTEYQLFYWNHATLKLDKGSAFVNPYLEGEFLVESFIGFNFYTKRYKWHSSHFQLHKSANNT